MAAMFLYSFHESEQRIITIPPEEEISAETFLSCIPFHIFISHQQVIKFIYTESCEINGENAIDLMIAASVYQLHRYFLRKAL
jgi:hypothetical protein